MCGIAGIFTGAGTLWSGDLAASTVQQMIDVQRHRGPDAEGIWRDKRNRCHLGHRRLSIIDTSDAGRQPMVSTDERRVIVFNGEIYNYLELKPQLQALARDIRGRTDTEVLLEAMAAWGVDALPKLDGMFAFAIFDRDSGELLLARDAFGEKPLYYAELPGGGLAFASELRALERVPNLDLSVSCDAVGEYLQFQYINAPRTIYAQVKKLPPGHWLRISASQPPQIGRYFRFEPRAEIHDHRPIGELADELEDILVRGLKRRLISDVPLGAFLSGGVDSSTVCALIRKKIGSPLKTFSVGFDGYSDSEHLIARDIAKHLGTEHRELIVRADVRHFLDNAGALLDEPNGDSSCLPVYWLSELTRQHVTVAISGDGGDEMFLGYGRYFATIDEHDDAAGAPDPRSDIGRHYLDRVLVMSNDNLRTQFNQVSGFTSTLVDTLAGNIGRSRADLACVLRRTDVDTYLPGAVLAKVDRMSMQHSLEVRTPFLSIELSKFCERFPKEALYRRPFGKLVLREVMRRYLPRHVVDAPKRGFGLPTTEWGRDELMATARERLGASESRLRRFFGARAMDGFLAHNNDKRHFSYYQLWETVVLESWLGHRRLELPSGQHRRKLWSGIARRRNRPQQRALYAWPVFADCFVVFEDPGHDVSEVRGLVQAYVESETDATLGAYHLAPTAARLFDMLYCKGLLSNLEFQRTAADDAAPNSPIRLPYWRGGDGDLSAVDRSRLSGAVLLLPHSRIWHMTRRGEVERFRRLGVAELVFWEEHQSVTATIRMNRSASRPRAALFRLWAQRIASWRKRDVATNELGMHEIDWRTKARRPDPKVDPHQLVLFEGFNQLIPSFGNIRATRLSPGRYRIATEACEFAPRRRRWWPPVPHWLVERNEVTAKLLDFDVKIDKEFVDTRGFLAQIDEIVTKNYTVPLASAPVGAREKIVLVTSSLAPGGAERQWCYLARGLRQLGVDVDFIVTDNLDGPNNHYRPLLEAIGIEPIVLNQRQSIKNIIFGRATPRLQSLVHAGSDLWFAGRIPELVSVLVALRPSAIIAQLDSPNLMAGIAGQLADVPRILLSFRNYNPDNFSYLAHPKYRPLYLILSRSPRIRMTANASALCADYADWIGVNQSRVQCIPNAIDEGETAPASAEDIRRLRAEFGISERTRTIVGAFRLSWEKRPLVFIDVCAKVAAAIPDLLVLVAGIGPLQDEIDRRIAQRGLKPVIRMIGRRGDVGALLSIAEIALHTASFEGMPNVLMEAQALGVPVVATATGGVPDVVISGRTGFVADVDDVDTLARHCILLLQNPALSKRFGQEATKHLKQFADVKTMAKRYLDLTGSDLHVGSSERWVTIGHEV
jgi:asparagine synthase (glutamine-hydrolysing)